MKEHSGEIQTPQSRDTIDCMVENSDEEQMEIKPECRYGRLNLRLVTYQLILDNIKNKDFEIVVLVEGIEPVTSSKLQARYSYAAEDIIANRAFKPCVSIGKEGEAVIDFCKFHETVPIDPSKSGQDILFMQSII